MTAAEALDVFATLPVWARVTAILGFPTAIALVLLAVFLGWLKSPLTDIINQQQQQIGLMSQLIKLSEQSRIEERATFDYQNILLRTLCRTYAKPDLQAQCEPRYRGYEEPQRRE